MNIHPYIYLLIVVALSVSGLMLSKKAMTQIGEISISNITRIITNPYLIVAVCLYGMSFLTYLVVLSKINLSLAYPSHVLGLILVLIISRIFFKETMTSHQMVGIGTIILGMYLIYF